MLGSSGSWPRQGEAHRYGLHSGWEQLPARGESTSEVLFCDRYRSGLAVTRPLERVTTVRGAISFDDGSPSPGWKGNNPPGKGQHRSRTGKAR